MGCGKCCLNKLEDEDTGDIHYTRVACQLLDLKTCRLHDYANRKTRVPDCLDLRELAADDFNWLPTTCAYRLLTEQKDLPDWHHLKNRQAGGFGTQSKLFGSGVEPSTRAPSIPMNWRNTSFNGRTHDFWCHHP